jgi:hypothetical protein
MNAVRDVVAQSGETRLIELTRAGLNSVAISTLLPHSGFKPFLSAIASAPDALPLIRSGAYLEVLEEARRRNVQNLADLQTAQISSADIRNTAERIQQLIRDVPATTALGVVDPAVLDILRTDAFRQLCQSSFFDSVATEADSGGQTD